MEKDDKKNSETIVLNSVFYNKPIYLYIFKKVTKIASAVYLITDLIKDNEPLKWELRKNATVSMSFINFTKDMALSLKEIFSGLTSLHHLVELGKTYRLIGEMNANILEKEINDIVSVINKEAGLPNSLSEDFFFVSLPETEDLFKDNLFVSSQNPRSSTLASVGGYKGHYKRQNNDFYNKSRDMSFKNPLNQTHKPTYATNENKTENKSHRKEQILKIIKDKVEVTIKDITLVIRDCSEKTIQRELIDMLSSGLIKKTGERRWSKYSLIS